MSKIKPIRDFVQDDSFIVKVSHNPTLDITGAVFELTFKKSSDITTPALLVSHTAGSNPDDVVATGTVYIKVTREHTSSLSEGSYFVSLKRTIGTDTVTLFRSGKDDIDKVTVYKTLVEKVT